MGECDFWKTPEWKKWVDKNRDMYLLYFKSMLHEDYFENLLDKPQTETIRKKFFGSIIKRIEEDMDKMALWAGYDKPVL